MIARRLRLAGHVQGVGFRPFVFRLARELQLTGTVQNLRGEVEIIAEGRHEAVHQFVEGLIARAPPLARPRIRDNAEIATQAYSSFAILESASAQPAQIFVPPDSFTCEQCEAELHEPGNRRHRYPFINCTQCGPRYTLIQSLPYDRCNTTMSRFPLCAQCRDEYDDPLDRRFHAEPTACPVCGPKVWLEDCGARRDGEAALESAVSRLRQGAIVAVKGVGGYHLVCDAGSEEAVLRLRERKHRPGKPLAVMFPQTGRDGCDAIREHLVLSTQEAELLSASARPIVLLERRAGSPLASGVAPGLMGVGALLPYSPLHHLLLSDFGGPLVVTSGNISGEPVLTEPEEARERLSSVADAFLHHDRPIARAADDSVMRVVAGRAQTVRAGRGLAPIELELPWSVPEPVLAVGGHLKTTVALAWSNRVVVSPHIGDMGTVRSAQVFAQVIDDLQRLYDVEPQHLVCDAHPDYATTRWAARHGLPVTRVLHHHAHASALAGEHEANETALIFVWDGVGLGADRTLWGGETFSGRPGAWQRVASLRPFSLPGGESAGRSPWRSAAALCWEVKQEPTGIPIDPLARLAWERALNCPRTSAVGRLFDGASALVLGLHEASYEGEGPMRLEAAAHEEATLAVSAEASGAGGVSPRHRDDFAARVVRAPLPLYRDETGLERIDWQPLIPVLQREDVPAAVRARAVHEVLAATIVALAEKNRARSGIGTVGLTGGVFQNRLLTTLAYEQLSERGFRVWLAGQVPCNDGGLSYGQLVEYASRFCVDD